MGKNVTSNFSRNYDIFAIKMTYLNALLSFLLSSCFSARSVAFSASYRFSIFMRTFRDIVTAVVYCYITTEFHYTKRDSGLLAFGGVMFQRSNLQRFVWEKTLTAILAEIMIFLQ